MPRDAVAEVDAPGQRGRFAAGVVGEAGEEAADAADGDAEAERDGEEIAGAGADVRETFDEFDGEPPAEQSADDGLAAAGEGEDLMPVESTDRRVLEQPEDAAAEECADGSGRDDCPTALVAQGVAGTCALVAIESVPTGVAEGLEDWMKGRLRQQRHEDECDDAIASDPRRGKGRRALILGSELEPRDNALI